jgi:hypothetical protein
MFLGWLDLIKTNLKKLLVISRRLHASVEVYHLFLQCIRRPFICIFIHFIHFIMIGWMRMYDIMVQLSDVPSLDRARARLPVFQLGIVVRCMRVQTVPKPDTVPVGHCRTTYASSAVPRARLFQMGIVVRCMRVQTAPQSNCSSWPMLYDIYEFRQCLSPTLFQLGIVVR